MAGQIGWWGGHLSDGLDKVGGHVKRQVWAPHVGVLWGRVRIDCKHVVGWGRAN